MIFTNSTLFFLYSCSFSILLLEVELLCLEFYKQFCQDTEYRYRIFTNICVCMCERETDRDKEGMRKMRKTMRNKKEKQSKKRAV